MRAKGDAMTDAPELEPAALEAVAEYLLRLAKVGFGYDIKTADRVILRKVARYLTARSAPEAGKAVDALREANAFILAPAEDLKDGVLSRIRASLASLAEEGMRQGRAISASTRIWEYEGADGVWRRCRNADDACMWAEDGRRIREVLP